MRPSTTVSDVMTREVATIRQDQDLHELEKLLLARKVHGVPVIDDHERIVGVVSQSDLLAWHFDAGVDGVPFYDHSGALPVEVNGGVQLRVSDVRAARVAEIMSPLIHVIGPGRPLHEAARRMLDEQIHRLVVVDEAFHVIGLLSAMDLLRVIPGVAAGSAAAAS